ncbi:hypothetical protein [Streptomyces akebiae]|uniref:hypothetical protein n=1 Tax=Streptomyces akebiae TaxID=2865673 RepID=UPI002175CAE5|nr:hypothetical protein [Streptomyces akebiae]
MLQAEETPGPDGRRLRAAEDALPAGEPGPRQGPPSGAGRRGAGRPRAGAHALTDSRAARSSGGSRRLHRARVPLLRALARIGGGPRAGDEHGDRRGDQRGPAADHRRERRLDEEREGNVRTLAMVLEGWSDEGIAGFADYLKRLNTSIERLAGKPWPRP